MMLNAHPEVAVPSESRFIVELWPGRDEVEVDTFLARLTEHHLFHYWNLPIEAVRSELGDTRSCLYVDAVAAAYRAFAAAHGKTRWGDKTPRYIEHIPFLGSLFPRARFVHLVRDGRNVALSYGDVPFGPKTVARAAQLWSARVRAGAKDGRSLPPHRYYELKYEDLTADPEGQLRSLCAFLDLDFAPDMLDHANAARDVMLPRGDRFNPKVAERPVAGTRDWRRTMRASHVAVFEVIAGDVLTAMGYERRFPSPGITARARAALGAVGIPIDRIGRSIARD